MAEMVRIRSDNRFSLKFIIIVISSCLVTLCLQMTVTAMPLMLSFWGLSTSLVGISTTICTLAALFFRPASTALQAKIGERRSALFGSVIYIAVFAAYLLNKNLFVLMILRAIQGIGMSILSTAIGSMATACLDRSQMTRGMGYFGLGNAVGVSFGPYLGIWLSEHFDFNGVFLFGMLTSVLLCVMILLTGIMSQREGTQEDENARHEPTKDQDHIGFFRAVRDSGAVHPSLILVLLILCQTALSTYLALWGNAEGISGVSSFFSLNVFGMIVSRLFVGKICEHAGERRVAVISALLVCMSMLMIAFAQASVIVWAAGIIYGFGYGIFYSLLNAGAVKNSTPQTRGAANSAFFGAKDLGTAGGSLIWGLVLSAVSYRGIYMICAVIMIIAAVYYMTACRD